MAFVLACLKCGTKLRSATRLRAGRRLTCPTCRATFTLHADAEPDGRKADAIPDAVLLDDEDDDRPPARGRDDDDRPTAGRRRRDTSDRPARRRQVAPPVLLGVGIGVFFILLALGAGAYVLFRKATSPAAADLLAYAPADSVGLAGFDLDAVRRDERLQNAMDRRPPADLAELDRSGLRPADLSRALISRTDTGIAAAVRFTGPQDPGRYLGNTVVGKRYAPFTSLSGPFKFGYFADKKTLVLADRETTVQEIIDGGGRVRISNKLQVMGDRPRGPVWQASGRTTPFDRPRFGFSDEKMLFRLGPTAGSVAWLEPSGGLADVRFDIEFENRHQAGVGAGSLKSLFAIRRGLAEANAILNRDLEPMDIPELRRGYEGAAVTEDGRTVSAKLRLPAAEAVRLVEALRP